MSQPYEVMTEQESHSLLTEFYSRIHYSPVPYGEPGADRNDQEES